MTTDKTTELAARMYRIALRAFPSSFRLLFGQDAEHLLRDRLRDTLGSNDTGRHLDAAFYFVRALADAVSNGLRERWQGVRPLRVSDSIRSPRRQEASMLDHLLQDIRFAFRSLARSPGFTVAAVLTLTLGIGANTALFSVIDAVLLEPLPYDQPEQLVRIFERSPKTPQFPLSPANFVDYRAESESFDAMAVFMRSDAELSSADTSERLVGMQVSSGFASLLGAPPVLGRDLTRKDEQVGSPRVAVIGFRLWQRLFDSDPAAVGSSLTIDGEPVMVVGVAPANLEHVGGSYRSLPQGTQVDVWHPFTFDPSNPQRAQHYLNGIARRKAGVSLERAQAEMLLIGDRLAERYPDTYATWRPLLRSLHEDVVGASSRLLWILLSAVTLVLLVVCANVANLLLARGIGRQREIAVRGSLGASRGRLTGQLLTESLVLAMIAGALGSGLAFGIVRLVRTLGPATLPRLHAIEIDPSVLGFGLALSLATGVLFGCFPAIQLSRASHQQMLGDGGRSAIGSRRQGRLRGMLVVGELALAIILLFGAALLLRSLANLAAEETGFRADSVVTASIQLPNARYPDNEALRAFWPRLFEGVSALPGVVAAGAGTDLPWTGYDENLSMAPEGRHADREEMIRTRFHMATPGYFRALGIPLLGGREITGADHAETNKRLVANAAMVRAAWPELANGAEGQAVDRRLTWSTEPDDDDWFTIVGVIGDIKDTPGDLVTIPAIYFSYAQQTWRRELVLAVRTDGDPLAMVPQLRTALRDLDPQLPLAQIATLDTVAEGPFAQPRFTASLLGGFSLTSLLIALLGLASVIAFAVSQRRREVAVRLALGATVGQVVRLFLHQSLPLLAVGIGIGIAGALAAARLLRSLLFGIDPGDLTTLAVIVASLLAAAIAACLVPAWRVTRIDPSATLRTD